MAAQLAMRFFSSSSSTTPTTPAPSAPSKPTNPPAPPALSTAPRPPAAAAVPPKSPTSSTAHSRPRPPLAKARPPPGRSPLATSSTTRLSDPEPAKSGPSRVSEVLPGVICKLCGTSVPLELLGEHDCEAKPPPKPPAATSQIPNGSGSTSSPAQSGPGPVPRPSDPPTTIGRTPSPKPPVPTSPPPPPTPSTTPAKPSGSPPRDRLLKPSTTMENGTGAAGLPRRPSFENNRPDPGPSLATGRHPESSGNGAARQPSPPDVPRQQPQHPHGPVQAQAEKSPPPGELNANPAGKSRVQQPPTISSSLPPNAGPPPNRRPSPAPGARQERPNGPPVPHPHHAASHPPPHVPPPERITSPGFDRPSKRSNSETPYYIDKGQSNPDVAGGPPGPTLLADPGRDAAGVLSTFGVSIPDTKVGGEAGMAGVGRRGFAAVAQAAMFVGHAPMTPFGPNRTPSPGFFMPPRGGSPGMMGPYGPGGPPPSAGPYPAMYGPHRVGSPGMPPYGPGPPPVRMMTPPNGGPPRPGPGPQFLGPDAMSNGQPPNMSRTPSPGLAAEAGPSRVPSPLGASPVRSPPPRNPDAQDTSAPVPQRKASGKRPEGVQRRNTANSEDDNRTLAPDNATLHRANSDVSRYTEDSPDSPMRRSPSPMTHEDRKRSDDDSKTSSRLSDASSSYTSTSFGPASRQPVSNVKPGMRSLFRKGSNTSQGSNSSEGSSPVGVRLPFFEKLKAQAAKAVGGASNSGSSSSGSTALGKSPSQRSHSSSSSRSDTHSEGTRRGKPLPPVQERRESSSSLSDTELAYANFDEMSPTSPKAKSIKSPPHNIGRRPSKPSLITGGNSIPFPSPPETAEKGGKGKRRPAGRADSTSTTSSSSSSSALSSYGAHKPAVKPLVGVKIVAAGDNTPVEPQVSGGSRDMLGGDLINDRTMDPLVESPTSSPSPTTTSFSNASSKKKKQVRRCRKCLKMIHDGKWVHVDVGTPKAGVMCDWDWKDSYLPKCRRCEKPIEGHVISASDGQMVGKYHRGCFSCVRCNEPFPDKSFYVWDGMPHCKLHYHESNGSLCAAASCGQPIEGPCAVADDGSRYHPEHFVCDWEGGADQPPTRRAKCTNRLEDYWEVGPRKYCSERHAMWAQEVAYQAELKAKQEGRATNDAKGSGSKATKRRTMFIEQVVDKMAL